MTTIINGSSPSITFSDGSAQTSATRPFLNRIINGAMMIDQRNAGASVNNTTSIDYTLDRWNIYGSASAKFSCQRNAGSVTPPAGFINYLGITSLAATSSAATDEYIIQQYIEGLNISDLNWGTANASTVTLSFWVRSSLTGTFGGALANSGNTRFYPFSFTISSANTWEQKTVTIAGDTTGTWLTTNGIGIRVKFNLGTGSTYLQPAGSWTTSFANGPTGATSVVGTNGATFYITGVQLEVGSTATSFDYRPYGTELALCQRYFQRIIDPPLRGVVSGTNAAGRVACSLATWMRTAPTTTITQTGATGNARFFDGTISTGAISSITVSYNTPTRLEYDITLTASGYTNGYASCLYVDAPNNYSTAFNLSAEL